jgi:hypothetical protein
MSEQFIANKLGDELLVEFLPNCSHPSMGRNQLAKAFMESDCDKIIYLDSDITFEAGALVKLSKMPVDYVGGSYRFKFEEEKYPIAWLEDRPMLTSDILPEVLCEVAVIPAGFVCLSRKVFETLKAAHPDREFTHMGHTLHCYFQTPFVGGLHSEESFFAHEWRQTGGKIYLMPDITITHWNFDPVPYEGNVAKWLKRRNKNKEIENVP